MFNIEVEGKALTEYLRQELKLSVLETFVKLLKYTDNPDDKELSMYFIRCKLTPRQGLIVVYDWILRWYALGTQYYLRLYNKFAYEENAENVNYVA